MLKIRFINNVKTWWHQNKDYFNSMKAMFDDFASFPLPEWDIDVEDDEPITCFTDQKDFEWMDLVETNVIPERQVNHAIQVNSAIWE